MYAGVPNISGPGFGGVAADEEAGVAGGGGGSGHIFRSRGLPPHRMANIAGSVGGGGEIAGGGAVGEGGVSAQQQIQEALQQGLQQQQQAGMTTPRRVE